MMKRTSRPSLLVGDMRHNHNVKIAALMSYGFFDGLNGPQDVDIKHDPQCPVLDESGYCCCDCEVWLGDRLMPDLTKKES